MIISVILVVYKSDPKKLKNILNQIGNTHKIIIVDNSLNYDFSKINISKKIKIIRSKNIGNGAGINLALKYVGTKYAIYFDIDTNFKRNLINKMLEKAKKIRNFSVLIPNNGKVNIKKTFLEKYDAEAPIMLFNIKQLTKIKFFDEKFFLYFEEIDLFFRCKINNLKVYVVTDLYFKHLRATSIKLENSNELVRLRQWHYMWSMFYFYKKNYSYFGAIKKTFFYLTKDFIMIFINLIKLDKKNFFIRLNRLMGLVSSMLLLNSYKRLK